LKIGLIVKSVTHNIQYLGVLCLIYGSSNVWIITYIFYTINLFYILHREYKMLSLIMQTAKIKV